MPPELEGVLTSEGINSGVLLADAFVSVARLEEWAAASALTSSATSRLGIAWARAHSAAEVWARSGPRFAKAPRPGLQSCQIPSDNKEPFTAKSLEDAALAKALARAVAAAWRVGATTGLLPELRAELKATSEVDKMLRLVCLGASGAVNTWRAAVRAVERWEQWATAHALEPHAWTGIQLSRFLSDAGHSGHSVPTALRAGLKMFSDTLLLQWPLDHPLVQAVCRLAQRASHDKKVRQAGAQPCLTVEQLQHLEATGCCKDVPLGLRWAALLGCFLTHACLRFSDAQRSEGIQLGQSSLFGFCWRSKRRRTGFPWAALRSGFSGQPWADELAQLLRDFSTSHSLELDYVFPQFGADLSEAVPRPATYACAVGLLRRALRLPPLSLSEDAAAGLTLHACRRLLPTLAGQMLMSLESRRVLGHWGPQSAEPLRYDTSRCVSELAFKAQVSARVISGWRPGADFEPPPPLPAEPPPPLPAKQPPGQGWVANTVPRTSKEPRCLHILASPGVTKCGWAFGSTSRTPKSFFLSEKPEGPEFADCGGCSAPSKFRALLPAGARMPTRPLVPAGQRRAAAKACATSAPPGASSSSGSPTSSSGVSSDGTILDE